jgi:hypothetical protein
MQMEIELVLRVSILLLLQYSAAKIHGQLECQFQIFCKSTSNLNQNGCWLDGEQVGYSYKAAGSQVRKQRQTIDCCKWSSS